MTTSKEFLTVPLTRKYGSMPSLAQKSVISLEYKDEGFQPRRVSGGSDPPKTGSKGSEAQLTLGLPQVRRSLETSAKNGHGPNFGREIGIGWPLLERRQNLGVGQENAGATKTPNKEKHAVGSPGKRRLDDDVKVLPSRHSVWLSRISSFNERVNDVKAADTSSKPRAQVAAQGKITNTGQNTRGGQARKTQFRRQTDVPKKAVLTTNNDPEKLSKAFSVEREFYFQDYRQKCIQWLKSLPDSGMEHSR